MNNLKDNNKKGPFVKLYINDIKNLNDISSQDAFLFYIIKALSSKMGYCNASNKILASFLNVSEKNINRNLKRLVDKNYIKIVFDDKNIVRKKMIFPLK